MKLHDLLKTFLEDHVNLNNTRLDLLEGSIVAVKNAVRALEWGPKIISFSPQGSWAHETIIKPQTGKPFDADLLVFIEAKDGYCPKSKDCFLTLSMQQSVSGSLETNLFTELIFLMSNLFAPTSRT